MRHLIQRGGIIVSCQARADNPLHGPAFMAAMASAAAQGGAAGIRANGPTDIAAIRAVTPLPIIGILKRQTDGFPVAITPAFRDAQAIVRAGADIVAVDATLRKRDGERLADLIESIRERLGHPVMADIATHEEAVRAAGLGADLIATTLAGYTDETAGRRGDGPDFEVLEAVIKAVDAPVIAEGRFWTPQQVEHALQLGAHAVVIGTAITNPREITRRFVDRGSG
jgi:N-acylglucosamine-6-phosphate 2-epimerase/N-acetylmuramic acid 6-phosphate etherase